MRSAFLLLLLGVVGCQPAGQPASPPETIDREATIAPDVFVPYEQAGYPNLFQLLQAEADPAGRIQKAREAFAQRLTTLAACHNVETVDVTVEGSTPTDLRLFAYCTNSTERLRFRARESMLQGAWTPKADLSCPVEGFPCKKI